MTDQRLAAPLESGPVPGILYTPEQAARFLNWSAEGIRTAAKRGRIQHTRVPPTPRGKIRLSKEDMDAIRAAGRQTPAEDSPAPASHRRSSRPAAAPSMPQGVPRLRAKGRSTAA